MSQNYPYNPYYNYNGYYKTSNLPDIDYLIDSPRYSTRYKDIMPTNDFSYRRELVRLRQKLEERHNKIMQEKAAIKMFNEFKENWIKSCTENVEPTKQFNFENYPEKENYGLNSSYTSNANLTTPKPTDFPQTSQTTPVYSTALPTYTASVKLPTFPVIPLPDEYDTTTSIAKYIEHIQKLENEKEIFQNVVKALIDYQKRKQKSTVKLDNPKSDIESFKEEYLKKLDDVKTVAEDIKESVADFRYQMLIQNRYNNLFNEDVSVTPTKDENSSEKTLIDTNDEKLSENKNEEISSAFNLKGCVVSNSDYTVYNGSPGASTHSCDNRLRTQNTHQNNEKPNKCDTCHGYLMQKKYHEHLKKMNEASENNLIANKFSATEKQFPEQSPEKEEIINNKNEPRVEQEQPQAIEYSYDVTTKEIEQQNIETQTYPIVLKENTENIICSRNPTNQIVENDSPSHELCHIIPNQLVCHCGDAIKFNTNVTNDNQRYQQIEESKYVKCIKRVYNNNQIVCTIENEPPKCITYKMENESPKCITYKMEDNSTKCLTYKMIPEFDDTLRLEHRNCHNNDCESSAEGGGEMITNTHNSNDVDTDSVVSYFVKRVQELKEQCQKYRCMKDVLQKRVEEYSGMYPTTNRAVY